jgi:TolB-like protein/Tfp pilus assembly protein PilF
MPENPPTPANRAVFLSYASQDAEAAKRICEALRQAGIEVWFDQSELVGGDSWDAKIRGQIGSCALFVPVISAATQARGEGYFRLEWKLAVDRSHLMAHDQPFLLPVVIDATAEAAARVPPEFRTVQWTKLMGGETPPAFVARVQKLLGGEAVGGSLRPDSSEPSGRKAPPTVKPSRPWLLPAILGAAALVGLALWQPWKKDPSGRAETKPLAAVAAPVSEARKLANQAMQLLEDPNFTRETSWLADELCQRALVLEAGDAEIWAVATMASLNLYWNSYDSSATRREKMASQADRARQLDPKSVRAALVAARNLDLNYESADGLQTLRALHRRTPEDQHVLFHLIRAEGHAGNDAEVQELMRQFRALPRTGMLSLTQVFEVLRLRNAARYDAAGAVLDEMFANAEPVRGAYYEKLQLLLGSWHDLAEAEPFLETIPARFRRESAFGSAIAQYWLWRGEPEKTLQALALVPQDYFEEYYASEPKALHAGWAHMLAGRPVAAQAEWRNALALVDERLKTDSRNFNLLGQRCLLLALTRQTEAARAAWQLRVELGGELNRPSIGEKAEILLALGEPEGAIAAIEAAWRSLTAGGQARVLPVLRLHPAFAPIRTDPRLQHLIAEGQAMLQRLKTEQAGPVRDPVVALAPADKSVAVLAFANLSDDKANEYFSDGISEELLNVLAKVPGLKVSARTSAFYFKGKEVPIPEIAKQLGVAYVVEGSVRKSGDKVRITAQLIKADGGFHVWSDTFTRDLKDVFAVQDEIAGLIAQNLRLTMGASAPGAKIAVNPEAFELYVEARQAWNLRTEAGFDRAEELLNRALALEPGFARAHAALSDVWATRGQLRDEISQFGQRESPLMRRILTAAERAVALDPNSAEAHASLGNAYTISWRLAEATRTLRHAVALNPNYASAHQFLGRMLLTQGYFDEAVAELARAVELDPLSHRIIDNYAIALFAMGRPTEALAAAERALALRPDSVQAAIWRARCLSKLGRHEEAVAQARRVKDAGDTQSVYLVEVFAAAGLKSEAEAMIAQPDRNFGGRRFTGLLELGRRDEALAAINPAEMSSQSLYQSNLDPIRDDPRFKQVLATLGLTEADARMQAWSKAHPAEMPEARK